MIIVEKNPGQKIDYEVNKTKLTFDDDLTLNLAKREEDYAVHIDVCFDEDGALCIGAAAGRSYVAQIDIPPRQYKEVPATAAETRNAVVYASSDGLPPLHGSFSFESSTRSEPKPEPWRTRMLRISRAERPRRMRGSRRCCSPISTARGAPCRSPRSTASSRSRARACASPRAATE